MCVTAGTPTGASISHSHCVEYLATAGSTPLQLSPECCHLHVGLQTEAVVHRGSEPAGPAGREGGKITGHFESETEAIINVVDPNPKILHLVLLVYQYPVQAHTPTVGLHVVWRFPTSLFVLQATKAGIKAWEGGYNATSVFAETITNRVS